MMGTAQDIGDYAIIGDCRTAALVSRDGSIDWLCMPHFSGRSVFARLLDQDRGGRFSIRPDQQFYSSRRYLGSTAVLETTFRTASGVARLIDLMPIANHRNELQPMREVLRIAEVLEGEVCLEICFEPRPDYARAPARVSSRGALGWACTWRDELFLLTTDAPLDTAGGNAACGRVRLRCGQKVYSSLTYAKGDIGIAPLLGERAEQRLSATVQWWEDWSKQCNFEGPFTHLVLRSAITLKLMTFALSGAVVVAPTASLPETLGADRNWDYRYCWLRDAALTMRAFIGLGFRAEAGAFLRWLLHATRLTWPELQVMYDVYGRVELHEEELDHLAGFRRSRPVRIGNGAAGQLQLDVYGSVLLAALDYVNGGGRLQEDESRLLVGFGKTVLRNWREPDNGIWEMRGSRRHYTFSKMMCWLALDCLVRLHELGCVEIDVGRFRCERDAIELVIEARGYNQDIRSYAGELDGSMVDASLLLMGCIGYKPPTDERMRCTFHRIQERLGRNGLLLRYEDDDYDGMAREGAFGMCSFWAIDNLAKRGDVEAAGASFDHILTFANDVGLFAEEIDPATGALLGNFPQAFTHIGLITAALALARARKADEP